MGVVSDLTTTGDTDYFYNASNEKAHNVLTAISCALSILGCLIIFLTYFLWKDIRTSSRLILVYITIADFITVVAYLVNLSSTYYTDPSTVTTKVNQDKACEVVGILTTFSMISSFLWTVSLAVYLYIAIVKKNLPLADKLVLLFHVLCWGIPFAVAISAGTSHMIGYDKDVVTSGWCWIKVNMTLEETSKRQVPETKTIVWMLLAGKGWEILSFVAITVLYILIRYHMWYQVKDKRSAMPRDARNLIQRANRKMTWIPVVFLILRFWGTLRFLLFVTGVDSVMLNSKNTKTFSKVLLYLQGFGDCGQGWANCILFCLFTNKVYERLCHSFQRHTRTKRNSSRRINRRLTDSMKGVVSSTQDHVTPYQYNERSSLIDTPKE